MQGKSRFCNDYKYHGSQCGSEVGRGKIEDAIVYIRERYGRCHKKGPTGFTGRYTMDDMPQWN